MHDLLFVLSGGGVGRAHCAGHGELYLDCVMHDLHSVLCQVGELGEHIALSTWEMYLDCVMHVCPVSGGVSRAHCTGHGGDVPVLCCHA